MNFYQSQLRKYINTEIYGKPSFETNFSWQQLFWITKSQKRIGKTLNWFMIHGMENDMHLAKDKKSVQEQVSHIKRDFKKSRWDIFFQLGNISEFGRWKTDMIKSDDELLVTISQSKKHLNDLMRKEYNLVPSWREHMPDATIVLNLSTDIFGLRKWYSRSCKRYINKAKKQDLTFQHATKEQRPLFWKVWYEMSYDKWFAVLPKKSFVSLMEYISDSGQWELFLAMKDDEIVSGSVMLWIGQNMYYLYGATSRSFGDIWGHYRLKDQIFEWAIDESYETCDLLWVAPPYYMKGHYLEWVTRFKQSFGGETVLSVGNYDYVFNSALYRLMQTLKK